MLLELLCPVNPTVELTDQIYWLGRKDGPFIDKNLYEKLIQIGECTFPRGII